MAKQISKSTTFLTAALREWPLPLSLVTLGLFLAFGDSWLSDLHGAGWFALMLGWLLAVILSSAFAVVRHAESLARMMGEPLGTLVLTLSVTGIEVMIIIATMATEHSGPTLARDTVFAVVMIVLNGMVGLTLLVGGLRYHEQSYNLQGATSFLAVIVPLSVLSLIVPNFTTATHGPTLSLYQSIFLILMSVALYAIFLAIQNMTHREYFLTEKEARAAERAESKAPVDTKQILYHGILLVCILVPLIALAKRVAVPIDFAIRVFGAPAALGGLVIAALVLTPESLSAVRAVLANKLQRSINILLGSVFASIGLTIPMVLAIGLLTDQRVMLGLEPVNMILLVLTLFLSTMTFSSSRTNTLLGAVHLLLFGTYLMFIFEK
jgi:Ca2+:H+ antiporter